MILYKCILQIQFATNKQQLERKVSPQSTYKTTYHTGAKTHILSMNSNCNWQITKYENFNDFKNFGVKIQMFYSSELHFLARKFEHIYLNLEEEFLDKNCVTAPVCIKRREMEVQSYLALSSLFSFSSFSNDLFKSARVFFLRSSNVSLIFCSFT